MDANLIARIPGAQELADWFGRFPRFHDAYVLDFRLNGDGSGHIRLHAWNMTDRPDEKGFCTEKDFVADLVFDGATEVCLEDFQLGNAIVYALCIGEMDDGLKITIESSYGFAGTLSVKALRLSFQPGKPT